MSDEEPEYYEISAVARLTGISSHVLRVWERRYGVVDPQRSETKRRQYTQADIQRLALLKTLVDNGHAIGSVAHLSTEQLEERLSNVLEAKSADHLPQSTGNSGVVRIGQVGALSRAAVREAADGAPALRIVGEFRDMEELSHTLQPGSIDLLILEKDTIFPDEIGDIQQLISTLRVRRAILIYRFAQNDVIQPLDIRRITALRAPVTAAEIRLACIADIQMALRSAAPVEAPAEPPRGKVERPLTEIPDREFSDEQLVKVAQVSSVVKCECPQHLANLLSSLFAFEKYSEQCENRNAEDAELHAFLHRTTAECRSRMESALSEVLSKEGISI